MAITKEQWDQLCVGSLTREEIKTSIADPEWQKYRILLLGRPMDVRHQALKWWVEHGPGDKKQRQVQVTNYISALRRGGLIE